MQNDLNPEFLFENREAAAKELIDTLPLDRFEPKKSVVIGVSESGIYFAEKLSRALKTRMDILLTEAILAPNNSELAIAMVSETEEMVMHKALIDSFGIDEDYIYNEANRKYEETILSYVYKYRKGIPMRSLKGKDIVLVDESIETGLTMLVALKSMIEMGARSVYIATPVLDQAVYVSLLSLCDGVFCPHRIRDYISIEYYYERLDKLNFEELKKIIEANGVTGIAETDIK